MKGLFLCAAIFLARVDQNPQESSTRAASAAPFVCFCVCVFVRKVGVALESQSEGSYQKFALVPKSLAKLKLNNFHLWEALRPLGPLSCTPFCNHTTLFKLFLPSLPPASPLSHWNAPLTDRYQAPHPCLGSPFCLCFISQTKHCARMRDLLVGSLCSLTPWLRKSIFAGVTIHRRSTDAQGRCMSDNTGWSGGHELHQEAEGSRRVGNTGLNKGDDVINQRRTNGKYAKLHIIHKGLQVPGSVEFPPTPPPLPLPSAGGRQAGRVSGGTSTLLPRLPRRRAWPPGLPVLVGEACEMKMCSSDSAFFYWQRLHETWRPSQLHCWPFTLPTLCFF